MDRKTKIMFLLSFAWPVVYGYFTKPASPQSYAVAAPQTIELAAEQLRYAPYTRADIDTNGLTADVWLRLNDGEHNIRFGTNSHEVVTKSGQRTRSVPAEIKFEAPAGMKYCKITGYHLVSPEGKREIDFVPAP